MYAGLRRIAVLGVLVASGCAPETPTPEAAPVEAVAFPSLEPFRGSDWWKLIAEGELSRADLMAAQDAKAAADEAADVRSGPADLPGAVPLARRFWWSMVPPVVSQLEPLWGKETWTDREFDTATIAAEYLARDEDGVKLAFRKGDGAHNQRELRRVAAWFRDSAKRTEVYAAMVFTMDDGPYAGLPVPAGANATFKAASSVPLDAETTLELGQDAAKRWTLRCRRAEPVLWDRVLVSGSQQFEKVEFAKDQAVERVGPYGTRVHLLADGEHAHLYLAPDHRLLFYFVSW